MSPFFIALLILSGGSLLSLLRGARSTALVGTLSSIVAALLASGAALKVLLSGKAISQTLPWTVPGGEFSLLLDPLAAFFVLPIAVLHEPDSHAAPASAVRGNRRAMPTVALAPAGAAMDLSVLYFHRQRDTDGLESLGRRTRGRII